VLSGQCSSFPLVVQMHILLMHLILWMVLALGMLSAPESLRSATEDSSNRQQGGVLKTRFLVYTSRAFLCGVAG